MISALPSRSGRNIEPAMMSPLCPVCQGSSALESDLPSRFLRDALVRYYDKPVPDDIPIHDYKLYSCLSCTLEFAWPMLPGDDRFYSWITKQVNYYAPDRWEWAEVRRWLAAQARPVRVLEVGC